MWNTLAARLTPPAAVLLCGGEGIRAVEGNGDMARDPNEGSLVLHAASDLRVRGVRVAGRALARGGPKGIHTRLYVVKAGSYRFDFVEAELSSGPRATGARRQSTPPGGIEVARLRRPDSRRNGDRWYPEPALPRGRRNP